ncbi:Uncharacterised protein [Yersinia kristensenii]|nr:Uncharacterised protein [Yersinia kristensenii]
MKNLVLMTFLVTLINVSDGVKPEMSIFSGNTITVIVNSK